MRNAFRKLDPRVNGPISADESVSDQRQVMWTSSEENDGEFAAHHGNDDWF